MSNIRNQPSFNEKLGDLLVELNPSTEDIQKLAVVFQMLRTYKVYEALSIKPMTVKQIKDQLKISEAGTYRAIRRLRDAEVIDPVDPRTVRMLVPAKRRGGPYHKYWKLKDYEYAEKFKWQLPT